MPKANMLDKARMYLMRYAPKDRDVVEMQMIARSPSHGRRAATNFLDYDTREPVKMRNVDVLGEFYGPYTPEQSRLLNELSRKWAPAAAKREWEVLFDDGSTTYVNAFDKDEIFEMFNPLRTGKWDRYIERVLPTVPLL